MAAKRRKSFYVIAANETNVFQSSWGGASGDVISQLLLSTECGIDLIDGEHMHVLVCGHVCVFVCALLTVW